MPTHIQSKSISGTNGTASGFFAAPTTPGNLLIAVVTRLNEHSIDDGDVTADKDELEFQSSTREGDLTMEVWTLNNIEGESANIDVVTSGNGRVNIEFQEWQP